MQFEVKHQGKWVAIKSDKAIAYSKRLDRLSRKLKNRADFQDIAFALVPKGPLV